MSEEHRARNILFRQLMAVSHRDYGPMVAAFRQAIADDPDFIARACVHVCTSGSRIRDQQDSAIITLLQSPAHYGYREAGRCLLLGSDVYEIEPSRVSGLPPFRIFRIERFIRGADRKVPRLMRGMMTDYVRMLEASPLRFDGVALRNRRALKSAYKHYHVKPDERVQAILFDNNPPADSKLAVLKQIANEANPRTQARLVIEHKIPYTVAASVLPKMGAAVAIALVGVMSPQEALNSRAWVERSGILEIPEVRDAYVAKVSQATASVASAEHRESAKGADAEVQAAVEAAKETAVAESKRIERDTLILVDKSGSMNRALEVAQRFGSRIAPLCDGDLMVVAFNDYAQEIEIEDRSLAGWQRAFRGIRAGGPTSMAAGLDLALRGGFMPEQVILITDGGENRGSFTGTLGRAGLEPHVVVIRLPGECCDVLSRSLDNAGLRYDRFETDGSDYYIFDQVAAILGGPPALSLIEQILAVEMPRRRAR